MDNEVWYFRLTSNDQIAARVIDQDNDHVLVQYPMCVENKIVDGVSAINLTKFLPFTNPSEQFVNLKREHIISMTPTTVQFAIYWHNTIQYQLTFIQPALEANMININKNLEAVLSDDNQNFLDALRRYIDRMPTETSEKLH